MLENLSKILGMMDESLLDKVAQLLLDHKANRVWLVGNGGSYSTASHFASDLDCLGFDVKCLGDNVARLTAVTNDFGWDEAYSKQLLHVKAGDVLVSFSVHGGASNWSCNLMKAAYYAKSKGAVSVSFAGFDGGKLFEVCDVSVIVPSQRTFEIEGVHCVLSHVVRQKIEDNQRCSV